MGNFIDLTGEVFGRLTVVERVPAKRYGETRWRCKCACGNESITTTGRLRNGSAKSCGCLHSESARHQGQKSKKHGAANTRLYRIWTNMKTRCFNQRDKNFERWGLRGITVCDSWKNSFEEFQKWALNSGYDETRTLDRIDNNKGYFPENCRWTSAKTQARNTRKNRILTWNGESHCLAEWAEILQVPITTLYNRLSRLPVNEAFELSRVKHG